MDMVEALFSHEKWAFSRQHSAFSPENILEKGRKQLSPQGAQRKRVATKTFATQRNRGNRGKAEESKLGL
jgi:hypothetical protein